jgi:hypothetical protein
MCSIIKGMSVNRPKPESIRVLLAIEAGPPATPASRHSG